MLAVEQRPFFAPLGCRPFPATGPFTAWWQAPPRPAGEGLYSFEILFLFFESILIYHEREREAEIGRERSGFLPGSPVRDSIMGPLSQRQKLNH